MKDKQTTPSVVNCTNFKEYFLTYDSLENISKELVFSIFKRYMCKAGCHMCYLQNMWIPDHQFSQFVPSTIPPDTEAKILKFFDFFDTVSTIDDLYLLKHKHPHLFEFYVKYADRMVSTQMSDNAFVQQYPIMMTDVCFKNVYEISFSDVFLSKNNGRVADRMIMQMAELHKRSPILKIKVIIRTIGGETSAPVCKLVDFAHANGIYVGVHDDITKSLNLRLSTDVVDYQELNFFVQDSDPKLVLSEVVFLQYTSVLLTLREASSANTTPWFDIMTDGLDDVDDFIMRSLQAKLVSYRQYLSEISHKDSKHYQYYTFVVNNVIVNTEYNFIPKIVLKPWTRVYALLRKQGWVETQYGLVDTTCKQLAQGMVIPLFVIQNQEA